MVTSISKVIDVMLTMDEVEKILIAHCLKKLGYEESQVDICEAHVGDNFYLNIGEHNPTVNEEK